MAAGHWQIALFRSVQCKYGYCSDKSVSKDFKYKSKLGKYFHTNKVLRAAFGKESNRMFLQKYKLFKQT
jgi:hypothetical protein